MKYKEFFKQKNCCFAPNQFGSIKEALGFCKQLEKLGCSNVDIQYHPDDDDDVAEERFADAVSFRLPKQPTKRLRVLSLVMENHPSEISKNERINTPIDWVKDQQV